MCRSRSTAARSSSIAESGGRGSRTRESGFTILELLVSLTLATIISVAIATVGTQAQGIYRSTTSKVDVYQKFRYALDDIETTVRGWEPTTSLEFYVDTEQSGNIGGKNGHWDQGEETSIKGPNLDGGLVGEYDEGAKIMQRSYTFRSGPFESEHDAYKLYFRGPVEIGDSLKLANVEYLLVDPTTIEKGRRIEPVGEEVEDNTGLVLLKIVRYLDVNADNYDRSPDTVEERVTELCSNVTDFRVEYYYDNVFDSKPGFYCTPENEPELVESEGRPRDSGGYTIKEFLYGGFSRQLTGVAVRGRREASQGRDEPFYFNAPGGTDRNRFSQLTLGDPIYIWTTGATDFTPGEYTVRRNVNGQLYFQETVDSTIWNTDQSNLRYRAAFVPPSIRVSIRVLNDEGLEPRTLSVVIQPYKG